MKLGAFDDITKPSATRVAATISPAAGNRDLRISEAPADRTRAPHGLENSDAPVPYMTAMRQARAFRRRQCQRLITGESRNSAISKLARALHFRALSVSGPFVPVNCGGVPESPDRERIFGHRAAHSPTQQATLPFSFAASHGTLSRQIGEMLPSVQAKLSQSY